MNPLTKEQIAGRERTLLVAVLLSMWAPLATGIAVLLSRSTTQLADFLRRSIQLVALIVSWAVFRRLAGNPDLESSYRRRLERAATGLVAAALCISGGAIIGLALYRVGSFTPGGNAIPGLVVATLGAVTNSWFWRRYSRLVREQYDSILEAQRRMYGAKTLVDLGVMVALAAVVLAPSHPATRYVDIAGSLGVALYMMWSGLETARTSRSAP